tara:strand:- start:159 stop:383 length:225 start_codon:yes stop_codon:yes gene_type:complete
MNDILPEWTMTVMLLILAVMIFILIRQFEERIKQVKSDFYLEGYKDGCKATADKTTEMIKDLNKKNIVNKNEVL